MHNTHKHTNTTQTQHNNKTAHLAQVCANKKIVKINALYLQDFWRRRKSSFVQVVIILAALRVVRVALGTVIIRVHRNGRHRALQFVKMFVCFICRGLFVDCLVVCCCLSVCLFVCLCLCLVGCLFVVCLCLFVVVTSVSLRPSRASGVLR